MPTNYPTKPICYEVVGSRATTANDVETDIDTKWVVLGLDDELKVRALLGNTAPLLYFDSITNRQLIRKDHKVEDIGYQAWECTVHYALASNDDPSQTSFTFDTSGGTTHITQAPYGQQAYGTTPPNLNGAIGVTLDNVEGVDVVIPALKFSETHKFNFNVVTQAWVGTIAGMTGSTNVNPWRNFAANQVLFTGASGSSSPAGEVDVTFNFEVGINSTSGGLTVAGINGIQKNAFDYLWAMYSDKVDTASQRVIKNPKWIFVATVYPSADFSQLGIG